ERLVTGHVADITHYRPGAGSPLGIQCILPVDVGDLAPRPDRANFRVAITHRAGVGRSREERRRAGHDIRVTVAREGVLGLLRSELLAGDFGVRLQIVARLPLQHAVEADALALA